MATQTITFRNAHRGRGRRVVSAGHLLVLTVLFLAALKDRVRALRGPNAGGIPRTRAEVVTDRPPGTEVSSNAPAEAGAQPA